MPANVELNDFRWQFRAGDKYFIIGSIVFSGTYTTGGVTLSFTDPRSPLPTNAALVKASRAPWIGIVPNDASGLEYVYITPSQVSNTVPPNTTNADINNGLLKIFGATGTELAAAAALPTVPVLGLFIFQGME
jgi:hypothetical protein